MNRNRWAGALLVVTLVAGVGCKNGTPSTAVDAEKMRKDLADAVEELDKATALLRAMTSVPIEQRKPPQSAVVVGEERLRQRFRD